MIIYPFVNLGWELEISSNECGLGISNSIGVWAYYQNKIDDIKERQAKRIMKNVEKKLELERRKNMKTFEEAFVEGECEWCDQDPTTCEFYGSCKLYEDEDDDDTED